jgi:WNK lysine deficient protein kinase
MENNFRDSLDFKEQPNDNNNNNNNNYSSKITKENLETKISLLSLEGGTENESSMDMERKVVEESPKGRFQRFEEELGSGSQKKVYLAYDTDTGREVAWNAVIVNITDENSIKKIKAEIEILKPLKHPNIISFIFCFFNDTKNEIVFITELFSGGSLSKYLLEFKYPRLRLVKLWCQEILKGLKYLHEYKPPIIHRDIKCDNIFINKNTGEVKIGDLGLSIILKDTEYAEQFCGTIEYCSPEVYQKKYGVKCDIYSFGMSMIEMITGEKPYSECKGQIMVVCNKVKNRILPICMNKIKNEKVIEFIKKCLKPEEERPSADELLNDKFLNDLDSEENNFPAINNPELQNKYSNRSLLLSFRDIKNKNIEEPLEDSSSIDIKSNITYNNQNHNYNMKMNKNNDLNNSKNSLNIFYINQIKRIKLKKFIKVSFVNSSILSNKINKKKYCKLSFSQKYKAIIISTLILLIYIIKAINTNNYLNLYIVTHKDFNNRLNNPYYKLICDEKSQLKNLYKIEIIETNKNNDLHQKKRGYCEGSKIYYIWKNYKEKKISSKYVGFCHYNRVFDFKNNIPNLDKIFSKYDAIINKRSL